MSHIGGGFDPEKISCAPYFPRRLFRTTRTARSFPPAFSNFCGSAHINIYGFPRGKCMLAIHKERRGKKAIARKHRCLFYASVTFLEPEGEKIGRRLSRVVFV